MQPLVERCYPSFTRAHLTTSELQETLERHLFRRGEMLIRCVKAKHGIKGDRRDTTQYETPRSHSELFDQAKELNEQISNIQFDVCSELDGPSNLSAFLSREGVSKYHTGSVNLFVHALLDSISQTVGEKANILSNRARSAQAFSLKPLEILYAEEKFRDRQDNDRLISLLSQLRHGVVSVFHNNPYLHLSFLDYLDGSSFDIFAVDSKTLSIVPAFRSSTVALMRLCEAIDNEFEDGVIKQTTFRRPTSSDFQGSLDGTS